MKMKHLLPLAALLAAGCVTRTYTVTAPVPAPSLAEIQSLVQAHVADNVIVSQIQNSGTRYQLTANQIIELKNAGASDAVLNALINSASKATAQAPATTTTVVHDSYPSVYVDPWPFVWWGWGPYYRGYYHGGFYHHWR